MTLHSFISTEPIAGQPLSAVAQRARECGVNSTLHQIREAWTREYYRQHPDFDPYKAMSKPRRHGRDEPQTKRNLHDVN